MHTPGYAHGSNSLLWCLTPRPGADRPSVAQCFHHGSQAQASTHHADASESETQTSSLSPHARIIRFWKTPKSVEALCDRKTTGSTNTQAEAYTYPLDGAGIPSAHTKPTNARLVFPHPIYQPLSTGRPITQRRRPPSRSSTQFLSKSLFPKRPLPLTLHP